LQGELVGRDDAGAGEEETAGGEGVVAEEPGDQVVGFAFELGEGGGAREDTSVLAGDFELDRRVLGGGLSVTRIAGPRAQLAE